MATVRAHPRVLRRNASARSRRAIEDLIGSPPGMAASDEDRAETNLRESTARSCQPFVVSYQFTVLGLAAFPQDAFQDFETPVGYDVRGRPTRWSCLQGTDKFGLSGKGLYLKGGR